MSFEKPPDRVRQINIAAMNRDRIFLILFPTFGKGLRP
jgi:hypothetical protein